MCGVISLVAGSLSWKFAIKVKWIYISWLLFIWSSCSSIFSSSSDIFLQTQVLKNGVEVKLQRNVWVSWMLQLPELPVFLRPPPWAATAGHKSGTTSLALYVPLEPATGLLHRWFAHRQAVIMLACGMEPLHELRSASAVICLRWVLSV
jgi:hypothetical protein